jgi:hypothetical protein
MAQRFFLSNDTSVGYKHDEEVFVFGVDGNLTADDTGNILLVVPPGRTGTIVSANLVVGTNVEDGTDAASLAADVKIGTTSVFTTAPAIAKAAGSGGKNTYAAGTGITVPVLDAAHVALAAGNIVFASLDVTRTTPEVEYANCAIVVVVRWDAA